MQVKHLQAHGEGIVHVCHAGQRVKAQRGALQRLLRIQKRVAHCRQTLQHAPSLAHLQEGRSLVFVLYSSWPSCRRPTREVVY